MKSFSVPRARITETSQGGQRVGFPAQVQRGSDGGPDQTEGSAGASLRGGPGETEQAEDLPE